MKNFIVVSILLKFALADFVGKCQIQKSNNSENYLVPKVTAREKSLSEVEVLLMIPGLQVKKTLGLSGAKQLKEDVCTVDVHLWERSLEVTAEVKDEKGDATYYRYKANQLLSIINVKASNFAYGKDKVMITLKKAEEISWVVQLSKNGLDQCPDCNC